MAPGFGETFRLRTALTPAVKPCRQRNPSDAILSACKKEEKRPSPPDSFSALPIDKSIFGGKYIGEVIFVKAKNIMSKEITTVNPEDSIEKAAQLMKQHDIGSIPVCDKEKVVGIVTDRDIVLKSTAAGQNSSQQKVKDIMSSNPVVGSPEMDVHEVAKIMSDKQIRRLPIIENNNLVGVVALGDISVEPTLQDNAGKALKDISQSNGFQM